MWRSFLLLSFTTLTFSCTPSQNQEERKLVVKQAVAKTEIEEQMNQFSFISQPHRVTNLSFRVGGPVKQFTAYSGNYFKKGAVIGEIDPRDFAIRKERAEGIYLQAKAEYERIEVLYQKNNLSASTFDKAKAEYVSAKTAYETAQNELADTRLTAPFNGYVEQVFIEQHQDVKATQSIVSFVDIDQLRIELFVSQEIARRANSIDQIELTFDALPNKIYRAKVMDVSKSTTTNNLSYLLTALLPNPEGTHLPGMSGKVCFESEERAAAVTVPQIALMHRPTEGDYVWIIHPTSGEVSKRKVELGEMLSNGNVALKQGVKAGEQVAISGLRFLSNGMQVTTQN
ncbi:MAG: efflux RND transporter periplasmic adaptor subunit [Phocaeicola sp.]